MMLHFRLKIVRCMQNAPTPARIHLVSTVECILSTVRVGSFLARLRICFWLKTADILSSDHVAFLSRIPSLLFDFNQNGDLSKRKSLRGDKDLTDLPVFNLWGACI